jgi:beta-lactamase regulating signal transducer with metallopeptidase domain
MVNIIFLRYSVYMNIYENMYYLIFNLVNVNILIKFISSLFNDYNKKTLIYDEIVNIFMMTMNLCCLIYYGLHYWKEMSNLYCSFLTYVNIINIIPLLWFIVGCIINYYNLDNNQYNIL